MTQHERGANAAVYVGIRFFLSVVRPFRHSACRRKLHIILYQGRSIHQKTTEAKKHVEMAGKGSRSNENKRYFDDIQSVRQKQLANDPEVKRIFQFLHRKRE
jgi:hypothetical protein